MNLDSQLSDRDPGLHFGEIDADATFTSTWTHVNGGPVLRLAEASLQLCLRLMTDWALVRRHRIFVSCPHDRELSWHRFKPRLERRDFRTSHFDEAGGRCRPEAQERTSIVPDAERTLFIVRSPHSSGPRVRGDATSGPRPRPDRRANSRIRPHLLAPRVSGPRGRSLSTGTR
jgi:hypothetical protein